jgi:hypothetical protein
MKNNQQQGYLILTAVIIITAIAFFASTIVYMYLASTDSRAKLVSTERAYYAAQSGIDRAIYGFFTENIDCDQINATNPSFTNIPWSYGQFSVVGVTNTASTNLSASIDSSATIIPVVSTAGFAINTGIALIDQEIILYSGFSSNALLGAVRGANGTTATFHSNNAVITQNNCLLTSIGTVFGINGSSSATLQRAVSKATGSAFIVGNNGLILKGSGRSWISIASGTIANLNDIFMRSPLDGWVVGNISGGQSTILHWNGSNFTAIANPGRKNLRTVWAVSPNEAWAAGDGNLVLKWNGIQWNTVSMPAGTTNFYGISIIDSNGDGIGDFGFVVGEEGRIVKFINGTWANDDSPTTNDLKNVRVISSLGDGAFACGDEVVLRWREDSGMAKWIRSKINNSMMQGLVTADTNPQNGILDYIYIVGDNGTAVTWHPESSSWSNLSNTGINATGLAAVSATQVLVIGSVSGVYRVLSWGGGTAAWVNTGYTTNTPLNAIAYIGSPVSLNSVGLWFRVYN